MDDVAVMAPRKRSNTLPGTFTVPAAAAAADDDDDDNDDEPVQPDDDCHIADNDGLLLYARLPLRCHIHSFTLTCAHFKHIQLINLLLVFAPFRLRGVIRLDSIFDFGAVCLFISYVPPLILFSSLFPYLLPYLSFPLRIDRLHFEGRCRKRQLNLALVFCAYFLLCR